MHILKYEQSLAYKMMLNEYDRLNLFKQEMALLLNHIDMDY